MARSRRHGRRESNQRHVLELEMLAQPDDVTCGPTCLHAVYRYWGEGVSLEEVVRTVNLLEGEAGRGTLAVSLGAHALRRGYKATLYTFNLHVFDPTWFAGSRAERAALLCSKLEAQAAVKANGNVKFLTATRAYIEFLELGGEILFEDLTSGLISGHIRAGCPVLVGLSATYLYRASREYGPDDVEDDVRGLPSGHFVVLHGYEPQERRLHVADPLEDNPAFASRNYTVPMSRLVPAIMLGVLTYDGNLLVIEPAGRRDEMERRT
ncbi:MAG: C39 family peptidase [Phycisphaerales bacterium]|nr:C39 family peptidase [Phycisphaerales bacterium]